MGGRGGEIGVVAINLDAETCHLVYKLSYLNASLRAHLYDGDAQHLSSIRTLLLKCVIVSAYICDRLPARTVV